MAKKRYRPGRTVVSFFVGLGIAFGLVALGGVWKPELGLDLQGGTRITLIATGQPTETNLKEAASIIDQRVNGSGVSETEVNTQGNRFVVVEIPGQTRQSLVDTVKRQAQLRFRLVACTSVDNRCGGGATTPQQPVPGSGVTVPQGGGDSGDSSGGSNNRPPTLYADKKKNDDKGSGKNKPSSPPSESPSAPASEAPTGESGGAPADQPLKWMDQPDPASVQAFNDYQCDKRSVSQNVDLDTGKLAPGDATDQPLVTCDENGIKYLLSVSTIEGTQLKGASAGIPQNQLDWVVNLRFDGAGSDEFADISRALYNTGKQFAIVLDGQVISAPTMDGIITNGQAEISGDFGEAEANSLATSLKFGALPIAFEKDPTVEIVGPSLAGNQLSAGITAGIAGLLLVMLYCLLYYRGLGLVVLASLAVAGLATYAMVLLLSKTAGFTLTLPGIAGLIVAVGITADSFIVYFERIRDEMRDGRSMRAAVEAGWVRARNTCLAADAVSLLAALVLYIFAAGVVKGFAFALGLSTLVDLAVFFWFTHPMVSWLARFPFFHQGHKFSGLDRENLGLAPLPAGGKA